MTKHTPRPWEGRFQVRDANGYEICERWFNGPLLDFAVPEWFANFHLIAAAPEMLKELEHLMRAFENYHAREDITKEQLGEVLIARIQRIREAAAKAKGESK
jgi:hypothetical protein